MSSAERRFTVLYKLHHPDIERYVRRRAPDLAVRDVVAEVFLVAWRRIDQVPEPPLPWLYGVARRVLANEIRGVQRGRRLEERVADDVGTVVPDHAGQVAGRLTVAAAFDRLAEADREALRLVAWEELSLRDAARAQGCSMTAFAMRLHRARRRLQEQLAVARHETITAEKGVRR